VDVGAGYSGDGECQCDEGCCFGEHCARSDVVQLMC